MSNIIDEKIVEMRFDNSKFEKNVKESISSLDHLQTSIKKAESTKGLSSLAESAKNVDLSNLVNSIETVTSRFSTLGIIGATVISKLTTSAMNTLSNISEKIGDLIVQGGISRAMNIEKAKFQLQGLGVAWKQIYDDIDYGVSGTAYGLDAAANVASQLVASGVEMGDDMKASLRGISGVAAMTQSSYEEIGAIFTTVAGQGKVMTEQLRMLEGRGLNAAAQMGKVLGKSEEQIRDMVSKGKIDFEMFSKAMDDAFGEHAKEANKTLTGVTANIKSAFARMGAELISPLIENEGPLVSLLDSFRKKVNDFKKVITPQLQQFAGVIGKTLKSISYDIQLTDPGLYFTQFIILIKESVKTIKTIINPIKAAFQEMFPKDNTDNVSNFFQKFTALVEKMRPAGEEIIQIRDTFKGFFALLSMGKNLLVSLLSPIKGFITALTGINSDAPLLAYTEDIGNFLVRLKEASEEFGFFERMSTKLADAGEQLGYVLMNIIAIFTELINGTATAEGIFDGLKFSLLNIIHSISYVIEAFTGFDLSEPLRKISYFVNDTDTYFYKAIDIVRNFKNNLKNVIGNIANIFSKLQNFKSFDYTSIKEGFKQMLEGIKPVEMLSNMVGILSTLIQNTVGSIFGFVKSIASQITPIIQEIIGDLGNLASSAWQKLKEAFGTDSFKDIVSSGFFVVMLAQINEIVKKLPKSVNNMKKSVMDLVSPFAYIKNMFTDMKKSFNNSTNRVFNDMKRTLQAYQKDLNADVLLKIALAVGVLVGSMKLLSTIDPMAIGAGVTAIGALIAELSGSMIAMTKMGKFGDKLSGFSDAGTLLLKVAASVFIISSALKSLGKMKPGELIAGFLAISGLIKSLVGTIMVLSTIKQDTVIKGSGTLIAMAIAVRILATAVKSLGELNLEQLMIGLSGVGGLLLIISTFMKEISKLDGEISGMTSLIAIAIAMKILASAVEQLGKLDWEQLLKGTLAIAGLLAIMKMFVNATDGSKGMISVGIGLIAISASMMIFGKAMQTFGSMNWEQLLKGTLAIAGLLAMLSIFSESSFGGNLLLSSTAMVVMSVGLLALIPTLMLLANMKWEQLAKAGVGLLGIFAIVTAFSYAAFGPGLIVASIGLLAIGAAMMMLTPQLAILGNMPFENILKGLGAFAGALGILALAGMVAIPLAPGLLALSVAMIAVGASVALLGAGLSLAAGALSIFVASLELLSKMGSGGISVAIATLITAINPLIELIPAIMEEFAKGLGAMCNIIIEYAPTFGQAARVLMQELIKTIATTAPQMISTITMVLSMLLMSLNVLIPQVLKTVGTLLSSLLNLAREKIPEIVDTFLTIVTSILEKINEHLPELMEAGLNIILTLIQGIAEAQAQLADAAFKAVITIIEGLTNAINENAGTLRQAVFDLLSAIIKAIIGFGGNIFKTARDLFMKFIEGIKSKASEIINSVKLILEDLINKIKEKFEDFKEIGKYIIDGLIEGITSKVDEVVKSVTDMISKLPESARKLLGIKSPSRVFTEIGKYCDLGLMRGIETFAKKVYSSSNDMVTETVGIISKGINGISAVITDDVNLNPIIRPTLDLSEVTNGARKIDSLFENNKIRASIGNDANLQNGGNSAGIIQNFTQNNYSPKALSRTEIYRQTKNQFTQLKGQLT